jgi:hypothetical protein
MESNSLDATRVCSFVREKIRWQDDFSSWKKLTSEKLRGIETLFKCLMSRHKNP